MNEAAIPRVIHQTWRTDDLMPPFDRFSESWRRSHPGWRYRFWTDNDLHDLVRTHYPALWPLFDALPLVIEKVDIARCLILHHCGGVYADMDIECLNSFETLLAGRHCVLFEEPAAHQLEHAPAPMVSNAIMAASPRHPVFEALIPRFAALDIVDASCSQVLERTGPVMLTRALRTLEPGAYDLLGAHNVSPYESGHPQLETLRRGGRGAERARRELAARGVHAVHYWFGSWARPPIEPPASRPVELAGYTFYPHHDSTDHDYPGRYETLRELADAAEDLGAAGFNTAGYLKDYIRPPSEWVEWPGSQPNEGLYVRNAYHFGGKSKRG